MAGSTRRQFVQRSALTVAALCGRPLAALVSSGTSPAGANAGAVEVDPVAVRQFASSLTGRVITPESPEYDAARVVFNRAFDRRPALIARCGTSGDVARALDFARRHRLPLAVRGGGHSRAGFGVCDGGLVIDLSALNHVEVDSAKQTVRAGAGCLVANVDQATQAVGLATTMGGCPTVGIAGLTLGGGEGLLMSKYGAACDNLLSASVVTVDGRQLEASATANPDLFWALRGGGGNFGVVTALEYRLHRVTDVLSGTLTFPPGRIPDLLGAFARFVDGAPDEMNVVGVVLPSEQGARFHLLVCHCGDPGQGMSLLAPLRALKPEEDTIRVTSYLATQTTINPYAPVAHFQTNVFLPKLNAAAIAALAAATEHAPPNVRLFMVPLYGAVSRVPAGDTAFVLRRPGYEIDIMGRWSNAAEQASAMRWVQAVRDQLQPLARGVYSNQLGETNADLVRAAYGANFERLSRLKRRYDPDNVLRINQNIPPS